MSRTTDRVSTKANWRRPGHSRDPYGVKACRNFQANSKKKGK